MLKLVSVSVLLLLLCSCAQKQPGPSVDERIARGDARRMIWDEKFEQLPGTHINGLIQAWGEPEKFKDHEYRWFKDLTVQHGGYYKADGYTTQRIYDAKGNYMGSIDTPKERYVEPWIFEDWCEIRVTTDKNGLITQASYDGTGTADTPALYRAVLFPFSKEK